MLSIVRFISELFEHGQVSVPVLPLSEGTEFATANQPAVVEEEAKSSITFKPLVLPQPANDGNTLSSPLPWTPPPEIEVDCDRILQMLHEIERVHRLGCAGRVPDFSPDHALWAVAWLFRACRCLISRHVSAAYVQDYLALPWPCESSASQHDASAHYSVDLVLRFVPDLIRMGRGLAEDDPLLVVVLATCRAWPLSSVSVAGAQVDADALEIVLADEGLRRMYVERAMLSSDAARLEEARCHIEALAAVGACRQLVSPVVADVLWPPHPRVLENCAVNEAIDELPAGEIM